MMDTDKKTNQTNIYNEISIPLSHLGWSSYFENQVSAAQKNEYLIARVVGVRRNFFLLNNGQDEWLASTTGSLLKKSDGRYPVIGDWVLANGLQIHRVLERTNLLSRGAAGGRGKQDATAVKDQAIASNVDNVFIVCGLDRDFNLRRIERYLTLVYNCGMNPVIILTKADLHEHPEQYESQVQSIAFGVPVHLISLENSACLSELNSYLTQGLTASLLGSSGAGKSTLINRLCGHERQATAVVSDAVGKGKHTTTSRDLIVLPFGGMLIDNPGIREVAMGEGRGTSHTAFPDIEELAQLCKFQDCTHVHEPGCEVRSSVENGCLEPERLESYHKMQKELSYHAGREQKSADRMEKENWRWVSLKIKDIKKNRKNR